MIIILGDQIKRYRKQYGLSQAELAEGICTQATISLIEKQNKIPNMNTLIMICERLGIQWTDVIVRQEAKNRRKLGEVDQAWIKDDYQTVAAQLAEMHPDHLKDPYDLRHYNVLMGFLKLQFEQDLDEGIYYLTKAQRVPIHEETDIYGALTLLGMAIAYYAKHHYTHASEYISAARHLIDRLPENFVAYKNAKMWICIYQGRVLLKQNEWQAAIAVTTEMAQWMTEQSDFYALGHLYGIQAHAWAGLAQSKQAQHCFHLAAALSEISADAQLEQKLAELPTA
ncbi:helix-turn-helix transcriptional regulator [Lactobacillus selangorensis]|nr:helix-turn-helix transcriptional regulator [Lactobacillus selangorensis]